MRRIIPVFVLISLCLIIGTAGATYDEGFNERCVNDTWRTFDTFEGTEPKGGVLNITVQEHCFYGCRGGECLTLSHGENTLPIVIALSVFFIGFVVAAVSMRDQHRILGWLFFAIALTTAIVAIVVIVDLGAWEKMDEGLSWYGYGLITVLIIYIAYFFLTIIQNSFAKIIPYKQNLGAD